jgi:hypothetical protein
MGKDYLFVDIQENAEFSFIYKEAYLVIKGHKID